MSIDAMRQALEALDGLSEPYDVLRAQEALRAAIEQAQEPVAWVGPSWMNTDTRTWESQSFAAKPIKGWIPLFTATRKWQGLTKEEVNSWQLPERPTVFEFAQFVEAKLKEKNNA